ncbi:hypothetical protein BU24DRAFT_459962 [Aaosphaeria arxii CBS 175.79]|uniref:Ankyrin n=1 Tax=Aaosphaeria arxii CBS 175.79 TaxID=1450172 RepID=A0A6A5XW27_9PLEO|nr:uncharacterized protein BU24DRAFT_459962 [Aaosphaeria arxii CBS 175.79]KAF2016840.1 hypothetical protein BU24DRAFT_459962 [Aaosphaeria arxii CBS 175.79]
MGRRTLQELVQDAGINPVQTRQPCLPAPTQPAIIASEEDHSHARNLLVEQRRNDPGYKEPGKQLKRIFRSSKTNEKLQDVGQWEFTQHELDQALSAVIDKQTASVGLVQAFISLGAKVNFVEPADPKNKIGKQPTVSNISARRRSTVLQRAATLRKADSVSLLASSGADQTTLDEALRAALAANDHSCVQELLRHGANVNVIPQALADAVRSNDQNLVRLLLRAPKALRPEVISSCLPAAVQAKSENVLSLLTSYGADPNFNEASALKMAISAREYRLAIILVAGPIRMMPASLQYALDPALRAPTVQEIHQFIQLLLTCGLPSNTSGLPGLLISACKRNDTPLAHLLLEHGVPTSVNEAECLRCAISNANWPLVDAILRTPVSSSQASAALAALPDSIPKHERSRIVGALLQKGANGPPLGRWLVKAVEEADAELTDLLLHAGAPLASDNNRALQLAVMRKDSASLQRLLGAKPSPESLSALFPLLRQGHSPKERLETTRLLLEHGARGKQVDVALLKAVEDVSNTRDLRLITELVRSGADVNHDSGKCIHLAASQGDVPILQLLYKAKPSLATTSSALPKAFNANRRRRAETSKVLDILLANGVEEKSGSETVCIAVQGGPENLDIITRLIGADKRLLGPAFDGAIQLDDARAKASVLRHLLGMGISQVVLDEALISESERAVGARGDASTLELLLEKGASVDYKQGMALCTVVASGSSGLTKLLLDSKNKVSPQTVSVAFDRLIDGFGNFRTSMDLGGIVDIVQSLLVQGVSKDSIDSALPKTITMRKHHAGFVDIIKLLLDYGADPNHDESASFLMAAKSEDLGLFTSLLAYTPDFATLIPLLASSNLREDVLAGTLQACFENGCTSDHLEVSPSKQKATRAPLCSIIEDFPRSERLVKVLLDHGFNPDVTTEGTVDPSVGAETVTALVFALALPQKKVASSVILALIHAGASPSRASSVSEVSPISLAAREGRGDIVEELLNRGADASARDKWNRSALFYASSTSVLPTVQLLAASALRDDGSLQEAARCLQLEAATALVKQGHKPNFPSRLHRGRTALGELCLNAEISSGGQRSRARQLIRLFLDHGANPYFKARNERSALVLALDNVHDSLEVTEALLETEVCEDINNEKHMFCDEKGLWYSPIKYVELVPSHSRTQHRQALLELLQDKGCEPKYYSEHAEQPSGAVGMPAAIQKLADRQKEHELSMKLANESNEHARMLAETNHRDMLRREREQQEFQQAAAVQSQSHWQTLEQQKHDFEMERVRQAERMKRSEKVAWHNLMVEQERNTAAERLAIEDRKASAQFAHEQRLIKERQSETEHRANVERRALKEKEDLYERNMKRQKEITQRLDESAQLHARLRQERPAIDGPQQWGTVD